MFIYVLRFYGSVKRIYSTTFSAVKLLVRRRVPSEKVKVVACV